MKHYDFVKNIYTSSHPSNVSWDITNKCNLSCKHCFNNSGDTSCYDFANELTHEKAIDIAQQLVDMKVSQCCICGGETTLCDFLFDIIAILSSGGVRANMVSNGLLIDDQYARRLKEAGINNVQISVDGLGYQHDVFRNRTGAFDKAVSAVKNLVHHNIDTLISFCPNRYNHYSVELYIDYISNLGCSSIRMMPLLPLGRGKVNYDELCLDEKEQFIFIQKIMQCKEKYPHLKIEWGDPLEHLTLVMVNRRRNPAVMGILSNGGISITPYLNLTVANVHNDTLRDIWKRGYNKIWQNKEINAIIENIQTIPDLCEASRKVFRFDV